MLEIRITAPELSEAINNLARSLTGRAETTPNGTVNSVTHINTTSVPVNGQTEAVANPTIPVSAQQTAPTAQNTQNANNPTSDVNAVPTTQTVPTAVPQYTLEMIAKAGTALIDAGKMSELTALLAKYGVEALTALDPANYSTFAAELRAMGASI